MGQRHQLFVIAKINDRHRVLAAIHIQWLYGFSTLRQGLHLISIFNAQTNQAGLRRELNRAEKSDWTKDIYDDQGKASSTVFPFIATCLSIGTALNEESTETSNVFLLPIDIAYDGCDNDDGITVLDISDIGRTRYGLAFLSESELSWQYGERPDDDIEFEADVVPGLKLLKPRTYVSSYCKDTDIEGDPREAMITQLGAMPTVNAKALESIWPDAGWQSEYGEDTEVCTAEVLHGKDLWDISMSKVIEEALHSDPKDLSWLQRAEQLPDFLFAVQDILWGDPSLLKLPSGPNLLCRVIRSCNEIDLTLFPDLTLSEILRIVQLASQDRDVPVKTVTLPDINDLTLEKLQKIVSLIRPRELHLGETGELILKDVLELVGKAGVINFTCTALYNRALDQVDYTDYEYGMRPRTPSTDFPCGSSTGFPLSQVTYFWQQYRPSLQHCNDGDR